MDEERVTLCGSPVCRGKCKYVAVLEGQLERAKGTTDFGDPYVNWHHARGGDTLTYTDEDFERDIYLLDGIDSAETAEIRSRIIADCNRWKAQAAAAEAVCEAAFAYFREGDWGIDYATMRELLAAWEAKR